jgi:S1-C subfamily serine protease
MLKVTKTRIGIALVVMGIAIAVIGFFAKPTIRPRALGGPVAIVSVDPALRTRGFLGIHYESLTAEQRKSLVLVCGVRLTDVLEGGPADQSGIEVGEFLLQIDGDPVLNSEALREVSQAWKPDQIVKLAVGHIEDESVIERTVEVRLITYNRLVELATLPSNQDQSRAESK